MKTMSKYAYWLLTLHGFKCSKCSAAFGNADNRFTCPGCGAEMINVRKKVRKNATQ